MNSIDVIKTIYKPYRYTIIGKTMIVNTTSGDYVIKECDSTLYKLFNYLRSRSFFNFPNIIDDTRCDVIVYQYQEDTYMPKEQKALDLVSIVSNLHNKTTYFKEVSADTYKSIYDDIKSNIDYLNTYYGNMYNKYFGEVYHSPSHYLFMNNYYKITLVLEFCQGELDSWFDMVKDIKSMRVCLLHNNLSLDHYIKSNNDYLISWDNYKIDSPVLDLVNFYRNSLFDISFKEIFDSYNDRYPLEDYEKKLFFILISLPDKIRLDYTSEFSSTKMLRKYFDYIYKTEELIRPYYSADKKE